MQFEHVFVYGTLKTGQIRERNWPHRPIEIRRAWTRGRLYDTGPFPALTLGKELLASAELEANAELQDSAELPCTAKIRAGDDLEIEGPDRHLDCVAGQVWSFPAGQIERTLEVLDQIEGTNQPGYENEYDRCQVDVHLSCGVTLYAHIYVFARQELLPSFQYMKPQPLDVTQPQDPSALSVWPEGSTWSA